MMKLIMPKGAQTSKVGRGVMTRWIGQAFREMNEESEGKRPLWGEVRALDRGWRPSGLGEPNDRLLVASQLGYRGDPISEKLQRIFDAGNIVEEMWVRRFQKMGVLLGKGTWLPKTGVMGLRISGKIDIFVQHKYEPGRKFIVEVKSISSTGFRKLPEPSMHPVTNYENLLQVKGDVGGRMVRYLAQLQAYLVGLNMKEGILLMDNKDNQDYYDYYIDQDEEVVERMVVRLKWLETEYWAKQLLPPWNGPAGQSVMAKYKPDEVVPLDEMRKLEVAHDNQF